MTTFELQSTTKEKIQLELIKPIIKSKHPIMELAKEKPASVISVNRELTLNVNFVDPKTLDELYATVPEVSRAIDIRGSAIIYRGYEITPRDDSSEAKRFADLCAWILERSGGVNFFEQWQKNGDLYGDGYVEIVETDDKVKDLEHVHPYQFGYELEDFFDPIKSAWVSQIKLDKETQKPVGYATYKYDEDKEVFVSDKKIPLTSIAHLKYKMIGDAINGISLIQPMYGSILRKLKIENSIDVAARLVASPKIVIEGDFGSDEDAKEQAREAANLDVNDVVILQDGKKFEFVNPGKISLPPLREIFVVNITTASGIPRPILTSESSDINKATMQELMRQLRENMRSNMNKIINVCENKIFAKIGESYDVTDFYKIIPKLSFPEDTETEEEIINREEKKAATITSLSNSLTILNTMLLGKNGTPANDEMKEAITKSMEGLFATLDQTTETFTVNNDQDISKKEEILPEDAEALVDKELQLSADLSDNIDSYNPYLDEEDPSDNKVYDTEVNITLLDEDERLLKRPEYLKERHDIIHQLYEEVIYGAEIFDIISGQLITIPAVIKRHQFYIKMMQDIGVVHELYDIGAEIDETVVAV